MREAIYIIMILTYPSYGLRDCGDGWSSLGDKDYCMGSSNKTFNESRTFCQSYSAVLPVLSSQADYTNLMTLLDSISQSTDGSVIDVFIGVYQRQCVVGTDADCDWLRPFSDQWFWVDNTDNQITNISSSFWQILEFKSPLVTNPDSVSNVLTRVNSHLVLGSDNHTTLVDGFTAESQFLRRLVPLCSKKPEQQAQIAVSNSGRRLSCGSTVTILLSFVAYCFIGIFGVILQTNHVMIF